MKRFALIIICISLFFAFSAPVFALDSADPVVTTSSGFSFSAITDFIVHIFVPHSNYFNNKIAVLNDNVNKKLGGVAYLFHMITYFFKTMQNCPYTDFKVSMPEGFFYSGYKGFTQDVFLFAKPFIRLLRSVIVGFICIITAIACYKKLIVLFEK